MQMGGISQELTVVSQAWNTARLRAFARLEQEAKLVGADAVVGVRLTVGRHDWAAGAIEYVAVGTAVRSEGAGHAEQPALTDLSGQDYWKLWQAGHRPLGVVGASTVHYVVPGFATQQAQSGFSASWVNQELTDFTRGVYDARETALERMTAEAQKQGAAGVVGVSIAHEIEQREAGGRRDLVATFHVLGTAIGERGDRWSRAPGVAANRPEQRHTETPPAGRSPMSYDPTSTEGVPEHGRERLAQMQERLLHLRPVRERVPAGQAGRLRPARPRHRQLDLPHRLPAIELEAVNGDGRPLPGDVRGPRARDDAHGRRSRPARRRRRRRRPPRRRPLRVGTEPRRVHRHRHRRQTPRRRATPHSRTAGRSPATSPARTSGHCSPPATGPSGSSWAHASTTSPTRE